MVECEGTSCLALPSLFFPTLLGPYNSPTRPCTHSFTFPSQSRRHAVPWHTMAGVVGGHGGGKPGGKTAAFPRRLELHPGAVRMYFNNSSTRGCCWTSPSLRGRVGCCLPRSRSARSLTHSPLTHSPTHSPTTNNNNQPPRTRNPRTTRSSPPPLSTAKAPPPARPPPAGAPPDPAPRKRRLRLLKVVVAAGAATTAAAATRTTTRKAGP